MKLRAIALIRDEKTLYGLATTAGYLLPFVVYLLVRP